VFWANETGGYGWGPDRGAIGWLYANPGTLSAERSELPDKAKEGAPAGVSGQYDAEFP
jgi:hypothetical protein